MKGIIVAGISTDVGKTVCSAIITKIKKANYWKPISSGPSHLRDSLTVQKLVNEETQVCFPEAYHFKNPLSPHHAASLENTLVDPNRVTLPCTKNFLVIECAGGILVPLNNQVLTVDIFSQWNYPWVIVSKNYLGSINHTLLTVEALKTRKIPILGLIFNGPTNPYSESFICKRTNLPILGRVFAERSINPSTIIKYGKLWQQIPFWKKQVHAI